MTEANNALSTTSHLPNLDEAADLGAPKPTHKLDVNLVILTLILLVVTYNATRNSKQTYHQNITTTGGRTDEYTKPRYAQSYTDPEDRIFKKLFFGNVKEIGYREKEYFGIYPSSTFYPRHLRSAVHRTTGMHRELAIQREHHGHIRVARHRIRMEMVRY